MHMKLTGITLALHPTRLVGIGLIIVPMVGLSLVAANFYQASQMELVVKKLIRVRDQLQSSATGPSLLSLGLDPSVWFSDHLAPPTPATTVIDSVQQASASRGVSLAAVSTQRTEAMQTTLGRGHIKATLNGSYANIKLVLSDVMQQFPGLLVQQIVMRKMTSPTDVQAQVDLLLVSRPVESPAPLQ